MENNRIFIAGASGFVGRALIRALMARENAAVIAGVRDSAAIDESGIETRAMDLTRIRELEDVLSECRPDVIINAAAYGVRRGEKDSGRAMAINATGAVHLLEAAAACGVKRFIQLGTCSEYGNREGTVHEDMSPTPSTLYGATKAAATVLVRERGNSLGMDTAVFRLFNLWGEREASYRLFPDLVAACRSGRPLELTDGLQVKDYSYVGDVAEWIAELALRPDRLDAGIVNMGSGRAMPLREFVGRIAEILGGTELLRFGAKTNRGFEARNQIPDLARLEALLPDRKVTPIDAALERALESMIEPDSNGR